MTDFKKNTIKIMCAMGVIMLMIILSQALHENEIIFPEIAALVTGAVLAPTLSWSVTKMRFFICMVIGSTCGSIIANFSPFGLYLSAVLGLFLAYLIVSVSKTTFFPVVSSIILPILMHTTSIIYPISAAFFTLLIILVRLCLEQVGILPKASNNLYNRKKRDYIHLLIALCIIAVYLILPIKFSLTAFVAPPLLVLFSEVFTHWEKFVPKARFMALNAFLFTTVPTLILLFLPFDEPMKIIICGFVTAGLCIFVQFKSGFFCPPIAALGFLALIFPHDMLFTFPIGVSITTFFISLYPMIMAKKHTK